MRIALIGLHFAETVARLALALSREHEVALFLSRTASDRELTPPLRAQLEASVALHDVPHPHRVWMAPHGWRLARAIAAFRPDVVHAQEAAGWTLWAFRVFYAPPAFVLTVHDPHPHSGDAAARARTAFADARNRRAAHAIIVHGEAMRREMATLSPGARVHVVPYGALGEAAGPPPGAARFLMFGRLQAYKGLGVLLGAAERLAAQGRRFEVVIAGTGDDLDAHRDQIARMAQVRLDERYIPADEVADLFGACDAVVLPYLDATQSAVGAMAMAAARAVIASDAGALAEMVREGETGLLVPAGDAAALAQAMARMLDEPGLAARLGAGAQARAQGDLSWAQVAAQTVQVYHAARIARCA